MWESDGEKGHKQVKKFMRQIIWVPLHPDRGQWIGILQEVVLISPMSLSSGNFRFSRRSAVVFWDVTSCSTVDSYQSNRVYKNNLSATQNIARLLWKSNIPYRAHTRSPLDPFLELIYFTTHSSSLRSLPSMFSILTGFLFNIFSSFLVCCVQWKRLVQKMYIHLFA